jgi:DMSO/TMAO reductase YedYZ molybdopterin-dependent catalytic subunit
MDNGLPPGQRPLDRFPRYGTNLGPPPAVGAAPAVEIIGAVDAPGSLAVAELGALPRRSLRADFHCVAGWSARGLHWEGVPLSDVLRPATAATHVRFTGLDGHWAVMLLEDALAKDVLLADRLDDAPLDARHGAPVRLVAPAHYGFINVKHLCAIELLTAEPAQSSGAASARADVALRLLGYRRFTRARVWEEERHAVLPARAIRLLGRFMGP